MNETHYRMDLLKAMNQNLSARDRMYRMILEVTGGAFLYLESGKNEVLTMGNWEEIFDFEVHDKRDLEHIYEFVDEPYCLVLRELIHLEKSKKQEMSLECLTRKKNAWYRFQAIANYDEQGNLIDKVIAIIDVTKYKQQAEELDFYSYYDVSTELYNRNYFIRLLNDFINKAKLAQKVVSVMMIDIDDFHKINDGLGMIYGDEMIHQFGDVLKSFCDENVIACHLNSDVYCLAIYDPKGTKTPDQIHQAITQRLSEPFLLSGNQSVSITVTIGVAEYPDAASQALDLINCAEIVVLKGKAVGRDSYVRFDQPILKEFMRNLELESKLKDAMDHHRFELYYQPQYYCGNKKLRGMEALIRWHESGKEVISPSAFIPIAEKNGDIVPIGNWVVEEAIKQYARWRALFHCNFVLSINISARQFNQDDFVDRLLSILKTNGVDAYFIELEVTESILIEDFEPVRAKMKQLQDKGVRISLDDFGTGFSSLSYLKKLPINTLKIDKSFIDTVLSDSATRIITESIVNMVKSLGFESVAEGVEQEQQYKYLHAIGCDVIQGFYLGKPLPVEAVDQLLRSLQTVR
ncbi:MAG: bifunctional diguanylate cyclase/phosphodiesterase [Lachnospiraceae bacterium]|nr:bifunctional diguanylate cyclase/phosphodiesterase [Lachnospiraceae bacterium]